MGTAEGIVIAEFLSVCFKGPIFLVNFIFPYLAAIQSVIGIGDVVLNHIKTISVEAEGPSAIGTDAHETNICRGGIADVFKALIWQVATTVIFISRLAQLSAAGKEAALHTVAYIVWSHLPVLLGVGNETVYLCNRHRRVAVKAKAHRNEKIFSR